MTQVTEQRNGSAPEELRQTESRLWTEYVVALARKDECWKLREEAWHALVVAWSTKKFSETMAEHDAYDNCVDLFDQAHGAADAALTAWQRVAYPMAGISLPDEDGSSSE